jgi:hypothetical protein
VTSYDIIYDIGVTSYDIIYDIGVTSYDIIYDTVMIKIRKYVKKIMICI